MKKAALSEKLTGPSEWEKSVQLRMAGVKAATPSADVGGHRIARRLAGVRRQPLGDARAVGGDGAGVRLYPVEHLGRVGRRDRRERVKT